MNPLKRLRDFLRGQYATIKMRFLLSMYFKTRTLEQLEERVKLIQPTCSHHDNKKIYRLPKGGVVIFDYTERAFEINPKPHAR